MHGRSPAATRRCAGSPWNNPPSWPVWRQLLPHVLAVTDPARGTDPNSPDVPWLLDRAATYLQTRGELRPARALFERAHRLYQDMFGKDHARTLASAGYLGNNLRALGGWCQTAHLHGKLATGSAKSQVRTLHFGHYR